MASPKPRGSRRLAPEQTTGDQRAFPPAPNRITTIAAAILLLATVVLIIYVRVRLADLPLERDEGEYAYAGQLILEGTPPYELAYNMKFPGTYYAYAAVMAIFGQTAWGIRMGLLCVHLATVGLVFVLGRRVAGTVAGTIGAAAFALFAVDRWSMGVFAHATHFVALPMMAGLVVLHQAMRSGRASGFLASGVLMGLAVIMKQHAIAFAVTAAVLAAWSARPAGWRESLRRGGFVVAGIAVAMAALVAVLAAAGVLGRFWFWTFEYGAAYVSQVPLSEAGNVFLMAWSYITRANASLWYLGLAGLVLLFLTRWPAEARIMLLSWTAAGILAIVPGFYFRQHYFILLMPLAGLLVGVAIASIERPLARTIGPAGGGMVALALFAVAAGWYVEREARYLFTMSPVEIVRSVYATNPFLESAEIARYIKAHTDPAERIVMLGSEPQIFFYADRKSASGYMYMYPLMENQPYAGRMQDEFRREVESARPRYLVFVGVPMSWGSRPESDTRLLTWANEFTARCYELAGIADIDPAGESRVRWDTDSRTYQPRFPFQVWTFRRTDAAGCASPG